MNRLFTLSAIVGTMAVLGSLSAIAQPTLTAATAVPTAGIMVRMLSTASGTTVVSGNSGANQTWNLSGLAFTRQTDTLTYHACASTDDCSRYAGTTILSSRPQVNGVASDYYAASSTALMRLGNKDSVAGTAYHHIYTNPQDILRFPMSYNTGFVDSFAVTDTATNGTTTHFKRGSDTVLADGWGTLKTPSGTFANTLRVKEIITVQDSSKPAGGSITVTRSSYMAYTWYDAAHPYALAQTLEYVFGTTVTSISFYADVPGTATGVLPLGSAGVAFRLAPNPARGKTTLSLRLAAADALDVTLSDMTGRIVYYRQYAALAAGDHDLTLPTQGLAPGLYTVCIHAGGAISTGKLVVE